ncbi:MAG: hypothetical protein WCV00_04915 [Verrucomicrobiia bacterium]
MKTLLSILTLIAVTLVGTAAEFYVATNGDDANPGTKAKPFATLERARNAAQVVAGNPIVEGLQ